MWKKIGDFSLDYIGVAFSCVALRQIRYENLEFASKITKISLSTVDQELDSFRMFITASTPKELENLESLFKDAKLIFGKFGTKELYFDASNGKDLIPFFKALQIFETTISELETDLFRKYNRDYTDYSLSEPPSTLVESNVSLKYSHDEIQESLLEEPNKCMRYAQQGTKGGLEDCAGTKIKLG